MYMNRNLKIFLTNGIPIGIFMGILYSALYGLYAGLISGLSTGLIFGFLMFMILGVLHSRAVKTLAGENTAEAMETCQVRNIKLQLPYDSTFDLCMESLNMISRCNVRQEDRSQGNIIARSSINWKTWGDTISFDIERTNDEYTNIKVSSRPTSWTTLVDYGKNLENVQKIAAFLVNQQ